MNRGCPLILFEHETELQASTEGAVENRGQEGIEFGPRRFFRAGRERLLLATCSHLELCWSQS